MSPRKSRRVKLAAAWVAIFAVGVIAGWSAYQASISAGVAGAGERTVAAALGLLLAWFVLGVPFGAWLMLRRQGEQSEALRNLSEAMDQSHSAVMLLDLEGCIEYANRGVCQLFGYTRSKLLGKPWRDLAFAQPAGAGVVEVLATIRSGRTWEGEWTSKREDGTEYTAHGVVTPVKRRDGTTSCFVAVFDDVTGARRHEAELREARDLAEKADRAKGQFLATMSHEVRTPLNGIVGFTSLLLESELTSEQRDCVQTIKMSTEALIQLTGDVLDFARIESGKLALDPIACDPRECVEDALDFLATKAAEKRVELLHRIGEDVPAAVVIDGARLRQVLVNLIGNAVKFTHKGEVEVSVRRKPASALPPESGDTPSTTEACVLEFTVRDTGIGIAAQHHSKLFRPFSQVDESTTRRYGGTGLGLAICRNLVGLMGGTINLVSEAGQGSSFTFAIRAPIAAAQPEPLDLRGLRVGLAIRTRLLRRELADLMRTWKGSAIEADLAEDLSKVSCDCALVELDEQTARDGVADGVLLGGLRPETTFGLVPISLSTAVRNGLRMRFRALINKPIHHGPLFTLLSGLPLATASVPPTHFGFRVLVLEDNRHGTPPIFPALERLGCTPTLVSSVSETISQLHRTPEDFDLLFIDWQLPAPGAAEAVREIRSGKAGGEAQTMWIIALKPTAAPLPDDVAVGLNDTLLNPPQITVLETALRRFRSERLARKH